MEIKKEYGKGGLYSLLAKGGKGFGSLSVKAGIDDNHNVTAADRIAGAQMNDKEDGGRVYKFGGVNMYPHGGVHNNASGPDIQIMAKDSYSTAADPQPGRDFIYLVDGQPTDYSHADVANLLRAEGISGNNLNIRMNEIFTQLPSRGGSDEEERAFREREMGKVLRDIERMEGGAPDGSTQYETGREYMSKKDLGNIARDVARGGRAGGIEYSGRYSPIGQKGTPKNVNADQFLRALARNYGN